MAPCQDVVRKQGSCDRERDALLQGDDLATLKTAHVSFFSATQCGFYGRGDNAPRFGGLHDTFAQLEEWGRDLDLSVTKLIDLDPGADDVPIYLLGVKAIGRNWLLGCWNEVPAHDGAVASISKNSKVGQAAKVHANPISPDTIPGYATFFYVVPARNAVACITFDGAASRRKSMAAYVRRFLNLESKYAIEEEAGDGVIQIVGFTDQGDNVPLPVGPRFNLDPFQKAGRRDFLIANSDKVTKVIRRGHVSLSKKVDLQMFQTFVQFVRGDKSKAADVTGLHTVRVELAYTPTREELTSMITAEEDDSELLQWERLGFEVKGEDQPIWVDRTLARGEIDLSVERSSGVITLDSLATAVGARTAAMLQFLDDA